MGLPRLEKCCCFDLKTGNMILGSINAWFSLVLLVVMIGAATEFDTIESDMDMVQDVETSPTPDTIKADAVASGIIILIILFLAKLLFDLFFLYGVVKERRGIIQAYFIMWAVFTSISVFTFFFNIYKFGWKTITFEFIYVGVNGYAMLLSYSFYVQLGSREEI